MLLPGTLADTSWMFISICWALLALVLSGAGPGMAVGACPRACFCNMISKIVYCSRRGLPFIPEGIDKDTLQLNLNGNVFRTPTLARANFSDFPILEHLYLSECGIEQIEVETFVDLTKLQWLDLSGNRIKVVQDYTFRGVKLQHLFLNGNRNIMIRPKSFEGLETTGLYLHECSLQKVTVDMLAPLNNTLKYLWLNGNELERLDKRMITLLQNLSHFRLGVNPLHCNCEVLWLKEFYDKNGDIFKGALPPSCLSPSRLKAKYFNTISLFDFRCVPPVFNNIDAMFDDHMGRLKCSATGDPAPTLFWIQPTGESSKYNPPDDEDATQNEGLLNIVGGKHKHHDLSGMYICLAYNEAGNVTLTLNVTWPGARGVGGPRITPSTLATTPTAPTPGADSQDRVIAPSDQGVSNQNDFNAEHGGSSNSNNNNNEHHRNKNKNKKKPSHHGDNGGHPEYENTIDESIVNEDKTHLDHNNNIHNMNNLPPGVDGKNNNFTALNMNMDYNLRNGERMFNLTELVGAIIGTHVCTLLLCLIFMPIYLKRQWRRRHQPHTLEKAAPNETLYLNGLGRLDYLDTPSPTKR